MNDPKYVQIKTEDGLTLPGLLYEASTTKEVMINLHGNGSSSIFYQDEQMNDFAEALNKKGISLLLFNNRGAHNIKKRSEERRVGKEKTQCSKEK